MEAFRRLRGIMDTLRRECPWDRKQTMKSLRYLTIEEVHELSEAIVAIENLKEQTEAEGSCCQQEADAQSAVLNSQLKKELGDLAMHILFYCKIAEEQGLFSTADVYNAISDKLVDRHPFIYRKEEYHGESWEQLKMREGRKNVLEGVPASLPSLVKAVRIQEKVAGMSGEDATEAIGDPAFTSHLSPSMTEAEFGDLLFALVGWGLRHGINADDALCGANARFCRKYGRTDD